MGGEEEIQKVPLDTRLGFGLAVVPTGRGYGEKKGRGSQAGERLGGVRHCLRASDGCISLCYCWGPLFGVGWHAGLSSGGYWPVQ